MKKLTILAIAIGFVLCSNILKADDEPEFKNYNMISGYVEYKISGRATATQQLYFEEYGKYEAKYTQGEVDRTAGMDPADKQGVSKKVKFSSVDLVTPDGVYSISLDEAKGFKGPAPDNKKIIEKFEAENGNFDKVQEQTMKEGGFIKKGKEKVLDKDCDLWELEKNGANVKVWLWKGIELKIVQNAQGLTSTQEAVKIVEEQEIPFNKFDVPTGITWLDPKTGQPIKDK